MTPTKRSGRRLLLDECVPRQFLRALTEHSSRTAQEMGWDGVRNGNLLQLAAHEFEVIFTVDRSFAAVSDTVPAQIGIVILQAGSTDFERLLPHMPSVNEAIWNVEPGQVLRIPK